MKTREELEAMGLHQEWVSVVMQLRSVKTYATRKNTTVNYVTPTAPLFTPGHEPVGKEGRELLRVIAEMPEESSTEDSLSDYEFNRQDVGAHALDTAVYGYRDSLKPAVPEFEGWERSEDGKTYTKGLSTVRERGDRGVWHVKAIIGETSWATPAFSLPDAIKAANELLAPFEPADTAEVDPNPWRKTDGMSPPEEAGNRVIETVDGVGIENKNSARSEMHTWSHRTVQYRPTKWRYADVPK